MRCYIDHKSLPIITCGHLWNDIIYIYIIYLEWYMLGSVEHLHFCSDWTYRNGGYISYVAKEEDEEVSGSPLSGNTLSS